MLVSQSNLEADDIQTAPDSSLLRIFRAPISSRNSFRHKNNQ